MSLVLLLVLGLLMHATRTFSVGGIPASSGVSLALGYVLLTAFFCGDLAKHARIPRLTGYILAGIVVGPDVLGFLTEPMVKNLASVNGMAIALIAMTAGTELELRAMRPLLKSIAWITVVGVMGAAALLSVTVFFARNLFPFMDGMTPFQAVAVAAVLGVVAAAQSPAVVVALRDELDADGPVARTVLGVVVIADLVIILLFALATATAKGALGGSADVAATMTTLAWELPGSLVVGALIGFVLAIYLAKVREGGELFVLMVAFVIAEVGARLHFDPLLVALAAGIVVRNLTLHGDALHRRIESTSLPVYIVFFAVAGATLHLDALALVWLPATLIVAVRAVGLLGGARLGATLAGAPPEVRKYAGFGLLPQAGLALALSLLFARTFPEFGAQARALTLGIVALNELIAPAVYRYALVASGEAGKRTHRPDPVLTPSMTGDTIA